MPTVMRIKLVLAVIGLILFAAGARYENTWLRWAAIGLIAVAFLLRFVKPRGRDDSPSEP